MSKMKIILGYEGPIKGRIRFFMNKKNVKDVFKEMVFDVQDRSLDYWKSGETVKYSINKAIEETNEAFLNNDFGMYLFMEDGVLKFAFRDMETKDSGGYRLVG